MPNIAALNLDYSRPVKIAEDIYWVGFYDTESGLHCNPYIIIDGDEAVVIDGGSRPDFPTVMMKILQTGISPSSISALIYQHYDPDLCGSVSNFEDIIGRSDLKIISDKTNNVFIRHYYVTSNLIGLDKIDYRFRFASGRELLFIPTPYAHSLGSFVTFDTKSGVLFTSDLFGSYATQWDLFVEFTAECRPCSDYCFCPNKKNYCALVDILNFHRALIPSGKILQRAVERITKIPCTLIAPQHGSVIHKPGDIALVCEKLAGLQGVGIDGLDENDDNRTLGEMESSNQHRVKT